MSVYLYLLFVLNVYACMYYGLMSPCFMSICNAPIAWVDERMDGWMDGWMDDYN